ncbi:MAG: hypothetical protein J6M93_01605 [Succinivibrio sp.]|nr:hypothetical protein [Succinivibrio sp.]
MSLKIAIYGYDTDIGKLVLETLEQDNMQVDDLFPLSPLSGDFDAVTLNGKNYLIQSVDDFDFSKADIAFFISTQDETQRLAQEAREAGCIVIDDSHLYSGDEKVPLVLPELNDVDITKAIETRLVIPASSVSAEICLALAPLHDSFGVEHAVVTALESVSEHGRAGTETLAHETTMLLNGMSADHEGFPAQLAFNLHTRIGSLETDGYSDHENTIRKEVRRLMGRFSRGIDLTCIQVPVFYGHTIIVHVDLEEKTTLAKVEEAFNDYSDWISMPPKDQVLTPVTDGVNERNILVTRLKQDGQSGKSFSFVALMDNSRRGEAISCVKIAKLLAQKIK